MQRVHSEPTVPSAGWMWHCYNWHRKTRHLSSLLMTLRTLFLSLTITALSCSWPMLLPYIITNRWITVRAKQLSVIPGRNWLTENQVRWEVFHGPTSILLCDLSFQIKQKDSSLSKPGYQCHTSLYACICFCSNVWSRLDFFMFLK